MTKLQFKREVIHQLALKARGQRLSSGNASDLEIEEAARVIANATALSGKVDDEVEIVFP